MFLEQTPRFLDIDGFAIKRFHRLSLRRVLGELDERLHRPVIGDRLGSPSIDRHQCRQHRNAKGAAKRVAPRRR
jgi:hypothetical protein